MTAVVGKNGSGKTTLLRFLMLIYNINCKTKNEEEYPSRFIIVFEVDNKFVAYHYGLKNLKCFSSEVEEKNIDENSLPNMSLRCIYYSNVLSYSEILEENNKENNISTSSLLNHAINCIPNENFQLGFTSYYHQDIERQITFISNYKAAIEQFNIRYPEKCSISIIKNEISTSKWYKSGNNNQLFEKFFPKSCDSGVEAFKECMARTIFSSLIKSFDNAFPFVKDSDYKKITESIEEVINSENGSDTNAWDNLKNFLKKSKIKTYRCFR